MFFQYVISNIIFWKKCSMHKKNFCFKEVYQQQEVLPLLLQQINNITYLFFILIKLINVLHLLVFIGRNSIGVYTYYLAPLTLNVITRNEHFKKNVLYVKY